MNFSGPSDAWRDVYNFQRPHDALGLEVPASFYRPSPRLFPSHLPAVEYDVGDQVRKVDASGRVKFLADSWFVGKAFYGQHVALRPVDEHVWNVYYCHQTVARVDVRRRREL